MTFLKWLGRIPAHVWHAAFRQGNLRLWATILGAPPLCLMVWCGLDTLADLATRPDPVRIPIVMAYADILKLLTVLVGIIVVANATMRVRATIPAGGSLDISGDNDAAPPPQVNE